MIKEPSARRPLPEMVLAALVSAALGYVLLKILNAGILLAWQTIPGHWDATPAWYVLGILLTAAVLVYVIRRYVGDAGHSPLSGIKVSVYSPRQYLGVILAIVASLWGGVVLGPEMALVATGSLVGGIVSARSHRVNPADQKKIVIAGVAGAIFALFIGPALFQTHRLANTPTSIQLNQVLVAIVVALIVVVLVTMARLVAALVSRVTGPKPRLVALVVAALIVGISALWVQGTTDAGIQFIVTSGEEFLTELPRLTATSTIIAVIIFKLIAYSVSLGAGFRGGPFFPAMFAGAAAGLLVARLMGDAELSAPVAIVVGAIAAVVATVRMRWFLVIIIGASFGLFMGSWTLIPPVLVGAVVARLIPRWGDRVVSQSVQSTG
ncbi:MAG: chloride channel protein [Actinomycetes bacterium]